LGPPVQRPAARSRCCPGMDDHVVGLLSPVTQPQILRSRLSAHAMSEPDPPVHLVLGGTPGGAVELWPLGTAEADQPRGTCGADPLLTAGAAAVQVDGDVAGCELGQDAWCLLHTRHRTSSE